MKLWKIATALLAALSPALAAQNTTVTATVVDSDNVIWVGGTWTMQFVPNGAQPSIKAYNINGVPLSPSVTTQTGSLNGTGALSAVVYQNGAVTPALSQWKLTVCPLATSQCGSYTFTAAGASMDVSSNLTALIPAPRFPSTAGSYGYSDVEVSPTPSVGGTYWNVISLTQRYWNGTIWIGGTNSHILFLSAYSSLAAADAAAVAANFTICVDTNMSTTGNTTLNANWTGCGGIITRGSNTLTFTQPINNGSSQLFDANGTGLVTVPSGTGSVKASWFGAISSNPDSTNAINQAEASCAASHIPIALVGNLTVAGQVTFNGCNSIRGDGPQGTSITTISTSYTAGCGLQIQNAFDAYVAGISLVYSVPTAGISTASGICTESFRRGNIEHVLVTGANTCFDTSNAGGQANPIGTFQLHIDDFKCYNFTGHGMLLLKAVGTGSSSGDGSMLLTNVRFDNNSAPGGTTPKDFIELATSSDVHFDTINFQNTVLDGTGGAFTFGSDAHNTQLDNLHIEANTFACTSAGSVNCGFFTARGTSTLMVGGITFQNNVLNVANIVGGKWALFQAQTGGNFFRVQHLFSLQNTLTGMVSTPIFNYFESGAAATGDATLGSVDTTLDAIPLTVAAYGNFSPSTFKDYLKPSQFPWWFYGIEFAAADTDQTVDCNRPDHSQTLDYETPFTANHTLTLVTGTGYSNCQVRVFMTAAATAGTAFTLTVQDDAAHTIGTFTGSRSLQFNYTAHAVQWQLSDAGVLNDLFLSNATFEGNQIQIAPQTAASLGVNVTSPNINLVAKYWDGAASQSDTYTWRNVPTGTGNNPATVYTLTASGSSGGHSVSFGGIPISASVLQSIGTQTVSGCSLTAASGGASAGKFSSGTAGTCTVTITPGLTALHGYRCAATDLTTVADVIPQTTTSTTSCTISGTTASGDLITWEAIAF